MGDDPEEDYSYAIVAVSVCSIDEEHFDEAVAIVVVVVGSAGGDANGDDAHFRYSRVTTLPFLPKHHLNHS